jgi:hypothetical protein
MKLNLLITINAILAIGFGIAFALYSPLMMAFFAVPEVLDIDALAYWNLTAFARMFGAALFSFGLLLWSLRNVVEGISSDSRRGILFALFLAHLICAFVSITQQSAVWMRLAGWITSGIFVIFVLAYGYFLFVKKPPPTPSP